MAGGDWSRREVELVVDDYLAMLACYLACVPYSKARHREALLAGLDGRSASAVEYKHGNISAALLHAGMQYLPGYKPRANYQQLLGEVLRERISTDQRLRALCSADADRPMVAPELADILGIEVPAPAGFEAEVARSERVIREPSGLATNYLEREARNASLGLAGEELVMCFERERLEHSGARALAGRVEHVARTRGDHLGYDILSFETDGSERYIEVKTTKHGPATPFFVSRNELAVSKASGARYRLYRLFGFQQSPRLYTLHGPIEVNCWLRPTTYVAGPR